VADIIRTTINGQSFSFVRRTLLGDFDLQTNAFSREPTAVYYGWIDVYTQDYLTIYSGQVEGVVMRSTNTGVFFPFHP